MEDGRKELEKLNKKISKLHREVTDLHHKILYKENKDKIGLVYNIPFEIRIEDRPFDCLFKAVMMDEFGTLIGTLLGESFDFGKYGYVMIEKKAFSADQLGAEVKISDWNIMLGKLKGAIEINRMFEEDYE